MYTFLEERKWVLFYQRYASLQSWFIFSQLDIADRGGALWLGDISLLQKSLNGKREAGQLCSKSALFVSDNPDCLTTALFNHSVAQKSF